MSETKTFPKVVEKDAEPQPFSQPYTPKVGDRVRCLEHGEEAYGRTGTVVAERGVGHSYIYLKLDEPCKKTYGENLYVDANWMCLPSEVEPLKESPDETANPVPSPSGAQSPLNPADGDSPVEDTPSDPNPLHGNKPSGIEIRTPERAIPLPRPASTEAEATLRIENAVLKARLEAMDKTLAWHQEREEKLLDDLFKVITAIGG